MNKVSIIIPSYKSQNTIYDSVNSCLSQGEVVNEVIVIVDGIFDDTVKILKKIQDTRLRIVIFEKNKGAQVARNTGLKLSRNEYIIFLDSDDFFELGFVENLLSKITKKNEYDICFGSMKILDDKDHSINVNIPEDISWENLLISRLIVINIVGIHSILWKKKFIEKIGGWNPDVIRNQDGELVIRALLQTKKFVMANGSAAVYYQHNNSERISKKRSIESFQSQKVIFTQVNDYLINQKNKNISRIHVGLFFFCINKCIGLSREGYTGEEYEFWRSKIKWNLKYFSVLPKKKLMQAVLFYFFNKKAYKLIDAIKK